MKQIMIVRLCGWMSILYTHPFFCMEQNNNPPAIPQEVAKALLCSQNKTVIEYYSNNPDRINETLADKVTPLSRAIGCNNIKLTRWLLEHQADPNLIPSGTHTPPIMLIAFKRNIKKKDVKFIRLLLQYGALINRKNPDQYTALMIAAQNSASPEFIAFLVENGADPTIKNGLGNDSFYLGSAINQFNHMKKFFKDWQTHQKNLLESIKMNTPMAFDPCIITWSYLVNEFSDKPNNRKQKKTGVAVKK